MCVMQMETADRSGGTSLTPQWIKHFGQQAATGTTSRSLYNKKLIVVQKSSPREIESCPKSSEISAASVVSPVQQSVAQAAVQLQRDPSVRKEVICDRKNRKRRRKQDKLVDIFSNNV